MSTCDCRELLQWWSPAVDHCKHSSVRSSKSDLTVRSPLTSTDRAAYLSPTRADSHHRPFLVGPRAHRAVMLGSHWSKPRSPGDGGLNFI